MTKTLKHSLILFALFLTVAVLTFFHFLPKAERPLEEIAPSVYDEALPANECPKEDCKG